MFLGLNGEPMSGRTSKDLRMSFFISLPVTHERWWSYGAGRIVGSWVKSGLPAWT